LRMLKGSNGYLRNQVRKNFTNAALCLVVFVLVFFVSTLGMLLTLSVNIYEEGALLASLVPLGGFYFFLRRYNRYNGGLEGEERVAKLLRGNLGDDYFLINDLYLNSGGDIDHVVLGPTGVFVLETKNWSGEISCHGDYWQRIGRGKFKGGNPSLQVKRNAAKIARLIYASNAENRLNIENIVEFTNSHAILHLNNPSVTILRLPQLPNYITTRARNDGLTKPRLEAIAEEILKKEANANQLVEE